MHLKHLKPRLPGAIVRDPLTSAPLPPEGRPVVLTTYWRRRLLFGDVVTVPDAKPAAKEPERRNAPAEKREA